MYEGADRQTPAETGTQSGPPGLGWQLIGPASGLAFVSLLVAGMTIGDPNSPERNTNPDQSGVVIAEILVANIDQGRLGIALALGGVFCLIWFVASVYERMRRFGGASDALPTVALAGGIAGVGALLILMHGGIALTTITDYGSDPAVARALAAMSWDGVLIAGAPFAAFVVAVSLGALRSGLFPRWVGAVGLVAALPLLIAPIAFFGFAIFIIWIVVVSAAWLWRLRSGSQAAAVVAPAPALSRS
jgi:hypothetical protein